MIGSEQNLDVRNWQPVDETEWEFDDDLWRIKQRNYQKSTIYVLYYCANRAATNCCASLRVYYDLSHKKTYLAEWDKDHLIECINLMDNVGPTTNIKHVKSKILAMYAAGVRMARKIQSLLIKDNISIDLKKITNLLHNEKRKMAKEAAKFSRNNLAEICNANGFKDENEAFVLSYTTNPVRVLITQNKNLFWLCDATNLHIDATYRINVYSFPVIVLGFSDFDRSFYASAICFCQNEDSETILWILKEIKEYLRKHSKIFNCKNIIADNALAITSAVELFDKNILRTNCWAHIVRLMKKRTKGLKNLENELLRDIYLIQRLTDMKVYHSMVSLFRKKWSSFECVKEFFEKFCELYFDNNQNWCESYDIFSPSTNNGIERFNLTLKQKYLDWTRIDCNEFIKICKEIFKDYLIAEPELKIMVYNKADKICPSEFEFKLIKNVEGHRYYLVVDKESTYNLRNVSLKFQSEFNNFSDAAKFYNEIIYVTTKNVIKTWKDIYCSCYYFAKNKKCCHVYTYLLSNKLQNLIDENLLSLKNTPGRPAKIPKNASFIKEK